MKRVLFAVLLVLLAVGCKKEQTIAQNNIKGTWQVYKYLLYNFDQTQQFENQYNDYTITFNGAGAFTEFYRSSTDTTNTQGTYTFTNNYNTLVLDQTVAYTIDSVVHDSIYERQYTVFNLMGASVQLRTDTSQLYLQKEP